MARAEIRGLMNVNRQLICCASSSPVMGLVYNCPTAAYLISNDAIKDDEAALAIKTSDPILSQTVETERKKADEAIGYMQLIAKSALPAVSGLWEGDIDNLGASSEAEATTFRDAIVTLDRKLISTASVTTGLSAKKPSLSYDAVRQDILTLDKLESHSDIASRIGTLTRQMDSFDARFLFKYSEPILREVTLIASILISLYRLGVSSATATPQVKQIIATYIQKTGDRINAFVNDFVPLYDEAVSRFAKSIESGTAGFLRNIETPFMIPKNKWHEVTQVLLDRSRLDTLPRRLAAVSIRERTPRALFSIAIPDSYCMRTSYTRDTDQVRIKVRIVNGVFVEGILTKSILDKMIHQIHKRFGADMAGRFVSEMQFVLDWYMEYRGFSIGIADCIVGDAVGVKNAINVEISKIRSKVESVESRGPATTATERIYREAEIGKYLSDIRNIGMRLASSDMKPDNALLSMVISGAKGNLGYIAQIAGALGEQFVSQKIPARTLYGNRSSIYSEYEETSLESNGFVTSSFADGLRPSELVYHMKGARIGLLDTAMRMGDVGFQSHKVSKVLENTYIDYTNAVVNTAGVYSALSYGDYGCENLIAVSSFSSTGTVYMPFDLDAILSELEESYGEDGELSDYD